MTLTDDQIDVILAAADPSQYCTERGAIRLGFAAGLAAIPREQWRHVKTGGVYTILEPRARIERSEELVVVYRGTDGRTWVRPVPEFYDGRFVRVDAAQGGKP